MYAYCFASGEIEFGRRIPDGCLPVASGPSRKLREKVDAVARHAYDGKTLLVPGVPEASDENAAQEALTAFRNWIRPGFAKLGLTV